MFKEILMKWRKKRHIKEKISIVEKKMWDIEFLKEKLKAQREGFRQEYDRLNEMLEAATRRLDDEKSKQDSDKSIIENLEKYKERYQPDLEQLKAQISGIDTQIEGTNEGNGLNETIDGFRTVIVMLKEFYKKI